MKKTVKYSPYNFELIVYLSKYLPPFGQGIYFFGMAFVKYIYFMNGNERTNLIAWDETNDVIRHEYGYFVARKKRGFLNFWSNVIWDYIRIWIPHQYKSVEVEANRIKEEINENN